MTELVYRTEALNAKARMDALPGAMQVTDSYTRVTLIAIAAASVLSLVASAFVIVPIEVTGQGVLVDRSGELLVPVVTSANGYVDELLAEPGDRIEAGEPVARLRLPEMETAVDRASRQITVLQNELTTYDLLAQAEALSSTELRAQKQADITLRLVDLEARLVSLNERLASEKELLEKGYSTAARLLQAEISVQEVTDQIATARITQRSLDGQAIEENGIKRRERLAKLVGLDQARFELAMLQLDQLARQTLISPVGGYIAEIGASQGAFVSNGQSIINLISSEMAETERLSALVYVPLASGKQVEIGSSVLIQPSMNTDSTLDWLRATVTDVSLTPVTLAALQRSLGNDQLASLVTRGGPAFAVRVEFDPDPVDGVGYAWTSGQDPGIDLTRGTPLNARVLVERRSLLSLALPAIKGILGMDDKDAWSIR
jgi:NHLM bacteriocin system secretion protein